MNGERIAQSLKIPRATVARILKAAGLGKLKDLEPREPVVRYERSVAGELIHIDIRKLGRINGVGHRITGDRRHRGHGGWKYVFVAVDDASRLAFAVTFRDESAVSAIAADRGHDRLQPQERRTGSSFRAVCSHASDVREVQNAAARAAESYSPPESGPSRPQNNGILGWIHVPARLCPAPRSHGGPTR
jgi:hypothetical protein